jgi:hypothetical protein
MNQKRRTRNKKKRAANATQNRVKNGQFGAQLAAMSAMTK